MPDDDTPTTQLLARIRLDPTDAAAREALLLRTYERLALVARRLLGPKQTQWRPEDTYGLVHEAWPRLDAVIAAVQPASTTDFFGIVAHKMRQVLIDLIRKERPTAPLPPEVDGGTGGTEKTDWRLDLLEAVERLDPDLQRVFDLRYIHGLTHAEAAEMIGVDARTVKRRWADAVVELGTRLRDE